MARKFSELEAKMSPESRARSDARTKEMIAEMPLNELRRAMNLSQEALGLILGKEQPAISKIEHQTDMYVGTLRSYVEAIGGQLIITAKLPAGDVVINLFEQVRTPEPTRVVEPVRSKTRKARA